MYTQIGTFETKTKLSEILRKVEQGERFTITVRGRAVANMVPVTDEEPGHDAKKAALDMLRFPRIEGVPGDTVLEWIREGRK